MAKKKDNDTNLPIERIEHTADFSPIENLIMNFRNTQVIIDRDLAKLYNVDTKVLNQAVKRNIERFPKRFRFQLSPTEKQELVTNCDRFNKLKHSTSLPFAFTEQGVAMLSSVLRSDTAIKTSIRIIDAFVAMRQFVANTSHIFKRIETLEYHQLETDKRIDGIFQLMEQQETMPKQGVFFDGQIYDAYTFVADLVRSAKHQIILIDNYIDDTVLTLLDKRESTVKALIYTTQINKKLSLDIEHHNAQYTPIEVKIYKKSHDRFLMIDNNIYLIGASIKDLGKKLFGFSLMQNLSVTDLLKKIEQ